MKSRRTSNIELLTSNIEQKNLRAKPRSMFSVERSMFDVRFHFNRRAFSFAEVMFAVVILGIGFIMVAAVFPVAIRQTQSTGEENTAAAAARTATAAIIAIPSTLPNPLRQMYLTGGSVGTPTAAQLQTTVSLFPPTVKNYAIGTGTGVPVNLSVVPPPAVVVPFVGTRGNLLMSGVIQNTDPRFSYVAFYKRENNSTVAELIVISVANRNRPAYDSTDLPNANTQSVVTTNVVPVLPAAVTQGQYTTIYPDTVVLSNPPSGVAQFEGCTVSLPITSPTSYPYPSPIRTYTLGRAVDSGGYELMPADGTALSANTYSGFWGDVLTNTTPAQPNNRTLDNLPASSSCVFNKVTTLQPAVAYVTQLAATPVNPTGSITLTTGPANANNVGANPFPPPAAAPGAFVIIADDCPFDYSDPMKTGAPTYPVPPNSNVYQVGKLNGRIFRLGAQIVQDSNGQAKAGTYQLDPAYGMQPGGLNSPDTFPNPNTPNPLGGVYGVGYNFLSARCYIIGAGKDASGNTAGAAQDLGVFATYFQVQ